MGESAGQPKKKEWRRPKLRRLPIAATREGGKIIIGGNDGAGGGKGDTSDDYS